MKRISFEELQKKVSYNDYTAFVYDDGTQIMYSGGEISEDSLHSFSEAEEISICNMGELPEVKDLMRENLLAEFEPVEGVEDEGFEGMKRDFDDNKGLIAFCANEGVNTYMLVWF